MCKLTDQSDPRTANGADQGEGAWLIAPLPAPWSSEAGEIRDWLAHVGVWLDGRPPGPNADDFVPMAYVMLRIAAQGLDYRPDQDAALDFGALVLSSWLAAADKAE